MSERRIETDTDSVQLPPGRPDKGGMKAKMGFRDDRVALRVRRDAVERERNEALQEIERLKSIRGEAERARLRRRVGELSDQLDALHRELAATRTAIPTVLIATLVGPCLCG